MSMRSLLLFALLWPAPGAVTTSAHTARTAPTLDWPGFADSGFVLPATLVDATETYAYVGGDSGQVLRVRLSDWSNDGFIPLSGEITTALLDEAAGYAYFYGARSGLLAGDQAIFGADATPSRLGGKFLGTNADVSLTASAGQAGVLPGRPLTYTFTLGNAGPRGATGIVLTATLPLSTTFLAASPACALQGGLVRCAPAANLRVGDTLPLTASVTVDSGAPAGLLTATALVTASQPDPVMVNNSAVVTAAVVLPQVYFPIVGR
jgi:uncharacterized repeat protein (TIGR01451 family)